MKIISLALSLSLAFTAFTTTIFSAENIDDSDVSLSPYFFIEGDDPALDSFPLKETDVKVSINGVIADVYLTQTYQNLGAQPINAQYVFPASTRAAVHGMKMQIGDDVITAQIRERQQARQEFERAREAGQSASLLEQERPNVFSMSVANIMPQDVVIIELHYTEFIVPTDSVYEFVFPTVVGPRYSGGTEGGNSGGRVAIPYLSEGETPDEKYNITVNISAGIPLTHAQSKSHKVNVAKLDDSTTQITLAEPEDFAGNRDFILQYKLAGQGIESGLMLLDGEEENFFMLMVQPPERPRVERLPPREYIFIFDTSGSMSGFPLDTSKELLKNFLTELRSIDSFNLVLFDSRATRMSPKSVRGTEENIGRAINLINRSFGGGGTELAMAVKTTLDIPMDENTHSRSVVVLTDGYIDTERAVFENIKEIRNSQDNTNFFAFGVGEGTNRYLIEGMANAGAGEAFVVTGPKDIPEATALFRSYISTPILRDIEISYSGFNVYDLEPPGGFSVLFAQKPIVLTGKWRGSPNGSVQIVGKTGSSDFAQNIDLSEVKPLESNNALKYLWARKKIERFTDYDNTDNITRNDIAEHGVPKEVITELGLKYNIMTPYTSFVAVMETIRNVTGESTDVDVPLPLPSGVSNNAVGSDYDDVLWEDDFWDYDDDDDWGYEGLDILDALYDDWEDEIDFGPDWR
ncbi:MAG: VIT and VWA domain-containing protein [Oscillospiraceae bacterium]|nr:VIT and VWA domain-containing protein [Oscillospiraceae bacterium]